MPSKAPKIMPERARTQRAVARTPNVARTAATRAKLLKATIDCLYELGYHPTSTVVVTERAKVSRGAMLHHFPTKADLMMAASEHIVELRREMHASRLDKLKTDREKFLALIDVLWEAFETPSGIARIEIMLGSRSDAELGPRFRELNDQLEERHKERVRRARAAARDQGPHRRSAPSCSSMRRRCAVSRSTGCSRDPARRSRKRSRCSRSSS